MNVTSPALRAALGRVALAAGLLALVAAPAAAQELPHQFTVTTRAGAMTFERAASLNTSAFLGLDAEYGFSKFFTLGTSLSVARPNTHREDFLTTVTLGTAATGDTTYYLQTGQAVSLLDGSIIGTLRYPVGRVTPYALAGIGAYGMYLDPQVNNGQKRAGGMSTSFGGGLGFRLSDRAGISLEVRDVILSSYKADRLGPSRGRNPNVTFPEDFPAPPTRKSTVNNVAFSLGFRYVPSFLNAGNTPPSAVPASGAIPGEEKR